MWPGLTEMTVGKYFPDSSPATEKVHMKRQRNGLRTTQDKLKEKLEVIYMKQDIHPPVEKEEINQIFTSISTIDKKDGTIYVNNAKTFPIRSIDGYIAIFILYNWSTNSILATPIKYTKYETIIDSFQTHINYITKRGFKPYFNIIDNMASKAIRVYL